MRHAILLSAFAVAASILTCFSAKAQTQLPSEMQQKIDKAATDVLAKTGVPSASIAV